MENEENKVKGNSNGEEIKDLKEDASKLDWNNEKNNGSKEDEKEDMYQKGFEDGVLEGEKRERIREQEKRDAEEDKGALIKGIGLAAMIILFAVCIVLLVTVIIKAHNETIINDPIRVIIESDDNNLEEKEQRPETRWYYFYDDIIPKTEEKIVDPLWDYRNSIKDSSEDLEDDNYKIADIQEVFKEHIKEYLNRVKEDRVISPKIGILR